MSSAVAPSYTQPCTPFPTAHLRIGHSHCFRRRPKKVSVAVSHRVYWKKAAEEVNNQPSSLTDFHDVSSLDIERLKSDASWKDVEQAVQAVDCDEKPAVVVPGSLHGPSRRSRFRGKVQIKLMADSVEQRDMWLEQIRALIAPWKLIRKQMKQLQSFIESAGSTEQTRNGNEGTAVGGGPTDIMRDLAFPQSPPNEIQEVVTATSRPFSASHGTSKETLTEKLGGLPDELQKLDWVKLGRQKVAENATAIAEEAAQATEKATQVAEEAAKVAERAAQVAETAQFVVDVSKCVAGASTAFQLIVLSAKMVSRFAEAKRGALILPETLDRAIFLLGHVLRSLAGILDPTRKVEALHEDFAFKILEKTVDTMCLIEAQILRGSGSKFLNAKVVKEIESTMEQLERGVVLASLLPKPEAQPQRI